MQQNQGRSTRHWGLALPGNSSQVAAEIRRSATLRELSAKQRELVDSCAGYFINHRELLRYDQYLAAVYLIASGITARPLAATKSCQDGKLLVEKTRSCTIVS